MKKSFLLVLLAGLIFIVTLTAANLKLKSEYIKGNYVNTDIRTMLPSFSYIKEDINPTMERDYKCPIIVTQANENSIATDSTISDLIDFSVQNDTLFLRQSQIAMKRGQFFYFPVNISASNLKGVIASRNQITIRKLSADSLSTIAYGRSLIKLSGVKTGNLVAYGEKTAGIMIEGTDSIPQATITLKNKSTFTASNVIINNKTLNLGDSSFLNLSGKAIASFGVK